MGRVVLFALLVGCHVPGPLPVISNHVRAADSCERFVGTIHDLDQDGAPAVGATVIARGIAKHEDAATSDQQGWFVFPGLSHAQRRMTVFYKDLAFDAPLPARRCWPFWIGVHGHTDRYETPLVIR
jgi:hypothetical protein